MHGLSECFHFESLFHSIDQIIGPVVKLDAYCFSKEVTICLFSSLCGFLKVVVSKIKINRHMQKMEYESPPNVCF